MRRINKVEEAKQIVVELLFTKASNNDATIKN